VGRVGYTEVAGTIHLLHGSSIWGFFPHAEGAESTELRYGFLLSCFKLT